MMISTSILDCKDRIDSVLQLNRTNTGYIHIDVMDGNFVSNIQFQNIGEIQDINRVSKYPLDVHLMMNAPISYIEKLGDMNIEFITVHLEIDKDIHEIIKKIHEMGYKAGLSLKPNTDINLLEEYINEIDMFLLMSVEPGRGGQSFLMETVDRILKVKKMILEHQSSVLIEVDGGVNEETIQKLENVDIAVVGSYIIKSDDYNKQIENLRNVNFERNLKLRNSKMFFAFFFPCGILNFFVWEYLSRNIVIFLASSFCMVMGIVLSLLDNKNFCFDNDEKKLFKRKLFYQFLLLIGLLPVICAIVFSLVYCFSEIYRGIHGKLFILLIVYYESLLHYFPLNLMFLGFILISGKNLSEIKVIVNDKKVNIVKKK